MIPRLIEPNILKTLKDLQKVILIFGPRQAGKTTLVKSIQTKLEKRKAAVLYLNCDLEEDRNIINTTAITPLKKLFASKNVLLIDEAQHLDNPGLTLKIIYDNFPKLKTIATGSSSFQLKNSVSDALTGRYIDFTLYPLSFSEIASFYNFSKNQVVRKQQADYVLPSLLLYGLYPEIYLEIKPVNKQLLLTKITESYLFKDILMFQKIRRSQAIVNLAKALAYQVGSEISENELANRLKIDRKTVASYLDILEQAFVIVRVFPFSKNPRREIGKNYKVFFLDNGIRNSLIGDFHPLAIRADMGELWENFIITERLKLAANKGKTIQYHFWRTFAGAEIDWLERKPGGKLQAFECKYSKAKLSRSAHAFSRKYKTKVHLINKETYLSYI